MALPEQVDTVTLLSWPCCGKALSHEGFQKEDKSGNHSVFFLETPVEGTKFYRGRRLGEGTFRGRDCG